MKRHEEGARAARRKNFVRLGIELLESRNLPSISIDAGGGAVGSFVADTDFSGGTTYSTTAAINTSNVANPAPQAVYQTERYGNFTYTVPNLTAAASYNVRLDFAELYWNAANERLFNVSINGQQVLTNFDIFATAGGQDIAIAESFTTTANSSGQIVITFTSVKDNAKVDGIEITPASTTVPSAPTGLTAMAGSSQVSLSWSTVSGATSYNLYRGTSSGGETLLQSGLTGTSYTDTGLTNGTTYYYQVTAVNSAGESSRSAEVNAMPAASGSQSVYLDAGGGAVGNFLADTDFSGGTTYSTTAAINTSNVANPAPQAVYQTERYGNFTYTVPNLTAAASYNVRLDFAELYWNAPDERLFDVSINGQQVLTNFDIFATAGGQDIAIAESFVTTANASGQIGITFTSVKDNAKVDGIEITPISPTVPSAPTGLAATGGSGQVSLSWNAVSGASSYNLYRGTSSGGETLLQSGLTGTSYTDTSVTNGTTYYYQVTAVNSVGQSSRSAEVNAIPAASGSQSVYLDAGGGSAGNFVADTDFNGGTIYSTTNPINTSNVANPAPQAVYQTERYGNFTYTVPNLTAAASYNVRLDFVELYWNAPDQRLFNVSINGDQVLTNFDIYATAGGQDIAIAESFVTTANASAQIVITFTSVKDNAKVDGIEITPVSPTVPSAPTDLTAAAGSGQVSVSWNAVSGATSYNLYRGTSSGGETLLESGLTGTSYTNTGLTNGTTYYYQVTAVNSVGQSAKSSEVSATPTTSNWFSNNMPDPTLQALAQTDFNRDGSVTYDDMLGLLNEAVAEGTVTQNVLTSLQALASSSGAAYLNMSASVQGLAYNLADGGPTTYQGSPLGSLAVGSSATQLQDLVNKWFLGEDLPTVDTEYSAVSGYELAGGSLFGSSGLPQYTDIVQGQEGDCWLLASFAEIAYKQPGIIESSFTNDGLVSENGVEVQVWTYRYFSGTTPEYMTVNNYLPDNNGAFVYANYQQTVSSSTNVLWAPLMEKAYAEIDGGGYADLNSGFAQNVLPTETGSTATAGNIFGSESAYVNAVNSSTTLLTLACWSTSYGLVSDHDYAVISYNAANQTFQLYNPWGFDQPGPLTWSQLQQCFSQDGDTIVSSPAGVNQSSDNLPNEFVSANMTALDLPAISPRPMTGVDGKPFSSVPGASSQVSAFQILVSNFGTSSINGNAASNRRAGNLAPFETNESIDPWLDAFFAQWDPQDMS